MVNQAPVLRSLAPVLRSLERRRRRDYVVGVRNHLVVNVETEIVCVIVATDVYSIEQNLRKDCAHIVLIFNLPR